MFERLSRRTLLKEVISGIPVVVEVEGPDMDVLTEKNVRSALKKFSMTPIFPKLPNYLILFKVPNAYVAEGSYSHARGDDHLAHCRDSEICAGLNNIYVFPLTLWHKVKEDFPENPEHVWVEELGILLTHEATHIWHLRKNRLSAIAQKNIDRVKKAAKNMKIPHQEFNALYAWTSLRETLENITALMVIEGFAEFCQHYVHGEISYDLESGRRTCVDIKNSARSLDACFERLIRLTGMLMDSAGRLGPSDAMTQEMKGYLHEQDSTFHIMLPIVSRLGAALFYTVTFASPRISIDEMAGWNFRDLMRHYEKAAHMMGGGPVVSQSGSGIFSYKNTFLKIRDLRRKRRI